MSKKFPKYYKVGKSSTRYSTDCAIVHKGHLVCTDKVIFIKTPIEHLFGAENLEVLEGKVFNQDMLKIMAGCDVSRMLFTEEGFSINKNGVRLELKYSRELEDSESGREIKFKDSSMSYPPYESMVPIIKDFEEKRVDFNRLCLSVKYLKIIFDCLVDSSSVVFSLINKKNSPIVVTTEKDLVLFMPIIMTEEKEKNTEKLLGG